MIDINNSSDLSGKDIETIKTQISAVRINARGVVRRCVYGHPSVILLNYKKNPGSEDDENIDYMSASNPLWLTCPHLNDVIHEFENMGYIKKLEGLITSDPELSRSMDESHMSFYYYRKHVCGGLMGKSGSDQRMMRIFNSGVGGIRSLSNLKCLHLHYAHYLVGRTNTAGRITDRLLADRANCTDERCSDVK